jgi:predicted DNA-binding protein (UPF0251 family)
MPRRKTARKIVAPPSFKGYKPVGSIKKPSKEFIELLYEEYEALKLTDYDGMNHAEAAVLMGISRPTFARIYDKARKKIAKALVEVKEIKTVYGNAVLDKNWFTCKKCNTRFSIPQNVKELRCAMCKSEEIEQIADE